MNLAWVYLRLRESLPPEKRGDAAAHASRRSTSPPRATRSRVRASRCAIARELHRCILSFTILDQTFRFFTKDMFRMTALETGSSSRFIGVVAALVQGGLIRPLAKRYDEAVLIRVGHVVQALAFAALAALADASGRGVLYSAAALLALGNGLTQPSVSRLRLEARRSDARRATRSARTSRRRASRARSAPRSAAGSTARSARSSPYVAGAIGMVSRRWSRPSRSRRPASAQRKTSTQTS